MGASPKHYLAKPAELQQSEFLSMEFKMCILLIIIHELEHSMTYA